MLHDPDRAHGSILSCERIPGRHQVQAWASHALYHLQGISEASCFSGIRRLSVRGAEVTEGGDQLDHCRTTSLDRYSIHELALNRMTAIEPEWICEKRMRSRSTTHPPSLISCVRFLSIDIESTCARAKSAIHFVSVLPVRVAMMARQITENDTFRKPLLFCFIFPPPFRTPTR
ncbi:hypothetical protein BR93DRAFT_723498 [Coniochaeta sp. PMI_546]|nr:hypothetical protein BR93DRAFT_723498 [Coniochaeta sp. PMI_546]